MNDEPDKQPDEKPKRRRSRAKSGEGAEAAPKRRTRRKPADDAQDVPAAEAAEASGEDAGEAEKPKRRRRAAKPKAEAAAAAIEAAEAEATGEAESAPAVEAPEVEPAEDAEPAEAEPPARAAPRGRRAPAEPGAAPPLVRARARYVRSSARKARLVCEHIRGKSVEEARAILEFTPRAVARDWSKLLESAIANAEHNHELVGEDLRVQEAFADEGPTLKRYRPRAMGRATRIRKRTAHLTIALTPQDGAGEGKEGSR